MSRGYSKLYSRKLNNGSQASIQFDKLFHENSNRPSAAKSAGTIGRWGVISCTSLRSTNLNGRRDEVISNKRMRIDFSNRSSSKDPFTFDTDPDGRVGSDKQPPVSKPKKFFKSRNIDSPDEIHPIHSVASYMGSNRSGELNCGSHGSRKYNKSNQGSKKFFTSAASKTSEDSSSSLSVSSAPKPSTVPAREENKPPIVLRIVKGTSHLVNELPVSTSVQSSSKPASDSGVIVRSSRRKASVDPNCEYQVSVVHSVSKDTSSSITPPPKKSSKEKRKDSHRHREERVRSIERENEAPVPLDDVERAVAALEAGKAMDCEPETIPEGGTSDALTITAEEVAPSTVSNLSPVCYSSNQDVNLAVTCSVDTPLVTDPLPLNMLENEPPDVPDNEKDDQEKLLKAQELLAETYMDFTGTAEKLLQLPQTAATPSSDLAPQGKGFPEHDWFSDSEGSNSILDQINTLAESQSEMDQGPVIENTQFPVVPQTSSVELHPSQDLQDTQELEDKADLEQEPEPEMEVGRELRSGRTASPATKKGSIFKTRSLLSDGRRTRRAVYKHKWADTDKEAAAGSSQPSESAAATSASQPVAASAYDMDEEFELGKLTRVCTWPQSNDEVGVEDEIITRVRCNKKDKEYYTVVRNVKKAHQIQESGEFQEFNDDVEYILDALQDNNPIGTRCLSAITLASKCMAPAFRMHVRAHGTVTKFFRALHDATKDQSLALCTATVMFVLSQDRLNMDLDKHSLELMLNLLESDASHRNALDDCGMSSAQLHKNKQKVRELCGEIQSQGHAKHLNLDNITVGHLAMETLLSLTSRRAGEWFKEELRELGGLEHIVKTISECCRHLGEQFVIQWSEPLLDKLRKVDRCLRVLENVTHQHEENQLYLLRYEDGVLVDILFRLFCQCDAEITMYPVTDESDKESTGVVIREALLVTLKVLINLSHDFNNQSYGSTLVGQRKGIVNTCMHVILEVPKYVPDQKKFDLLVLGLILLINLVEHSEENRRILMEARICFDDDIFPLQDNSAVKILIKLFYEHEQLARVEEVKTDAILDGKRDTEEPEAEVAQPKSHEEFSWGKTVPKLLQKAGRNMEHTLIGAYIGLLLGYLIIDNKEYELYVRQCLPEGNFKTIISVLQKVYNFMNLTASAVGSSRGIAQTERVINCLIRSDANAASVVEGSSKLLCETSVEGNMSVLDESIS
ncbi:Protein wings apart-like [Gryllus bimaculatus]|nr:Protein wings apart-like [Gryllus bimaculatus]